MKNIKLFFGVALLATLLFSACKSKDPIDDNTPAKIGVKINGVVWAPYNVGATGKFVSKPEDYGGLYQWNRKDTANFLLEDDYFASDFPIATSWWSDNNPCPKGWRVPTRNELKALGNTDSVQYTSMTTESGIKGMRFINRNSGKSIFLPAAGNRDYRDGIVHLVGSYGNYWSSTESSPSGYADMYYLTTFYSPEPDYWDYSFRKKAEGYSVRCVAE